MKLLPITARAAIIFVAVLLLGGTVLAEQKPGDCGYYVNSNGHGCQVPAAMQGQIRLRQGQLRYAGMAPIVLANIPAPPAHVPITAASRSTFVSTYFVAKVSDRASSVSEADSWSLVNDPIFVAYTEEDCRVAGRARPESFSLPHQRCKVLVRKNQCAEP
jgi:hypothetical protein